MKFWTAEGVERCVRQLRNTAPLIFLLSSQCAKMPQHNRTGDHAWKLDDTWSKLTQVQTQTITSSAELLVRAGLTAGFDNLKGLGYFPTKQLYVYSDYSLHQPKAATPTLLLTAQAPRQFLFCSTNSLTKEVTSLCFSIKILPKL